MRGRASAASWAAVSRLACSSSTTTRELGPAPGVAAARGRDRRRGGAAGRGGLVRPARALARQRGGRLAPSSRRAGRRRAGPLGRSRPVRAAWALAPHLLAPRHRAVRAAAPGGSAGSARDRGASRRGRPGRRARLARARCRALPRSRSDDPRPPYRPRALPRRRQFVRVSARPGELLVETLTLGRAEAGTDPARLAADWATVSPRGLDRLVMFEGCALWLWRRLRELGAATAPPAAFADWLPPQTPRPGGGQLAGGAPSRPGGP